MNRCERACLAGVVAGAIVLGSAAGARACLFSNTASATANGVLAYRVTALPRTPRGEAVWAPFAFRQTFTPGRALHLREDMREVSGSMGRAALHWPVRWLFGDGSRAAGATTAHAYRHTGLYKVAV